MALHLFGKPRRRSRSSSSGMGKGVETVMTVAAIGALGIGAYFLLTSGAVKTGGRWMKNATDALDSTGEAIGNASCHIQKLFKPSLNCGEGYRFPGSGGGGGGGSSKDESKGIVDGLAKAAGGYFDWYKGGISKEIEDNEKRSLISRKDIGDFFNNLGCGTILRPNC